MIRRVLLARGSGRPQHPFQAGWLLEEDHGQATGLAAHNSPPRQEGFRPSFKGMEPPPYAVGSA